MEELKKHFKKLKTYEQFSAEVLDEKRGVVLSPSDLLHRINPSTFLHLGNSKNFATSEPLMAVSFNAYNGRFRFFENTSSDEVHEMLVGKGSFVLQYESFGTHYGDFYTVKEIECFSRYFRGLLANGDYRNFRYDRCKAVVFLSHKNVSPEAEVLEIVLSIEPLNARKALVKVTL